MGNKNTMATNYKSGPARITHALAAALLVISFFLPWVNWDGTIVKGIDMATGNFFSVSEKKFGVENPFPQFSFLFYVFWLIPILGAASAVLPFKNKKTTPVSYIAGAMSLALLTIYILFSKVLIDLGAGKNVMDMLKPFAWVHGFAAILLILTAYNVKNQSWKALWLLLGPVLAFASFKFGEKYVMGETHQQTENVKTDFKISANALIAEFLSNDTAANKKYVEKVLEVDGIVSAAEMLPDSSGTIKFEDSTGSYAIFSFDRDAWNAARSVQPGSRVVVKGICSGSIFSEILGTTSISFKRSTLNNK